MPVNSLRLRGMLSHLLYPNMYVPVLPQEFLLASYLSCSSEGQTKRSPEESPSIFICYICSELPFPISWSYNIKQLIIFSAFQACGPWSDCNDLILGPLKLAENSLGLPTKCWQRCQDPVLLFYIVLGLFCKSFLEFIVFRSWFFIITLCWNHLPINPCRKLYLLFSRFHLLFQKTCKIIILCFPEVWLRI